MGNCSNVESAGPDLCNKPLPQINQGSASSEQKVLLVTLLDRLTGKPIDLTTASDVTAKFPATNLAGFISKNLSSGIVPQTPLPLGVIQITLAQADVAVLVTGVISFTVYVTTPTVTNGIAQFLNALQVNGPPFTGA